MRKLRIVTLGGGGGHSQLLAGLRRFSDLSITAVCPASDSGGDTGSIVKEYRNVAGVNGSLGDVSKCLLALCPSQTLRTDFGYRFTLGSRAGQTIKNSLYLALLLQHGPEKGLRRFHDICGLKSDRRVLPVSFDRATLKFRVSGSSQVFSSETLLDTIAKLPLWSPDIHHVQRVWLAPKPQALPDVLEAIHRADYIILASGDLFTSVIPVMLVGGVAEALKTTAASIIHVMNLMVKQGETHSYGAIDILLRLKQQMLGRNPDVVLCNSNGIPTEAKQRYRRREQKTTAVVDDLLDPRCAGIRIERADLWTVDEYRRVVHDSDKTAKAIRRILKQ